MILLQAAPTASAIGQALEAGPDALVLDLTEPPGPPCRDLERTLARRAGALFVRIPPIGAPEAGDALAAAMALGADGILLAGATGRPDVEQLAVKLAVLEAEHGRKAGSLRILASAADHAAGTLALAGLKPDPRLAGLVFDGAALAASLGCAPEARVLSQAAAMTLLAASACGVPAIMRLDAGRGEAGASRSPSSAMNCLPPHAEVLAEGEPRSTRNRGASFEAPLRGAPQDEEGGCIGSASRSLREGFCGFLTDDPDSVAGLRALTRASGA